jgi:hypothetical protein
VDQPGDRLHFEVGEVATLEEAHQIRGRNDQLAVRSPSPMHPETLQMLVLPARTTGSKHSPHSSVLSAPGSARLPVAVSRPRAPIEEGQS